MTSRIQLRRDTQANWTTANPVLAAGETGWETDTGLFKIGDGSTAYNSLAYDGEDVFRLTANGSAIGPAISDFFASGAASVVASAIYEFEFEVNFLKTTAGTVTFTLASSTAPANLQAKYWGSPVGGIATAGTAQFAGIVTSTATAAALPATGSLTTAVNHQYIIRGVLETGTSGGTFKLQATSSAGTVTPLRGSMFKIHRIPNVNYGLFA